MNIRFTQVLIIISFNSSQVCIGLGNFGGGCADFHKIGTASKAEERQNAQRVKINRALLLL